MIKVIEVKTKKQQREFLNFPLVLYKDNPNFCPPLYGDDARIEIVVANPTAGSHCGPNCLGISFHSIKRD